jgi:hypothetical protein
MDWRLDSSSRAPALQSAELEFKPQFHKKRERKRKEEAKKRE